MDTNTHAYSLSQKRKGKIVNLRKQGVEEKIPTSGRSNSRSSQDHEADIDDKEENIMAANKLGFLTIHLTNPEIITQEINTFI